VITHLKGAGDAGQSVPRVFKRTPSFADLKPVRRFVAKHSYQGSVARPVMKALLDKHFRHGETAVRPPDRDAATRTGLRVRCGDIAPAGASVDDGGSTAVLTGRVSVQSRKAGRGGDRGGEIAEKKMCHADI